MNVLGISLIGDIGATNARLAMLHPDVSTTRARLYAVADHHIKRLIQYLAEESLPARPG
jgi:glucokinase